MSPSEAAAAAQGFEAAVLGIGDRPTSAPGGDWDERELWALEDNVKRFSIDAGRAVLWRRMVLEVPELIGRKPEAARTQWLALRQPGAQPLAIDPPSLEDWVCLGPGRYEGSLYGRVGVEDGSSRVAVEHDASRRCPDVRIGPGQCLGLTLDGDLADELTGEGHRRYIVTWSDRLFQLGRPAAPELAEAASGGRDAMLRALPGNVALPGDAVFPGAASLGEAARKAAPDLRSVALAGGVLLAAGAAWSVLGHHHIDVSVFVV